MYMCHLALYILQLWSVIMNYIFEAVLRFWHHGNNVTKDSVSWLIKSQQYDYSRVTVFYMSMAN